MVRLNGSGAVLLLVLVILVVLTIVVVQFMFSTRVDSRIADNYIARLKNDAAIDGGVAKAISLLRRDGHQGKDNTDSLQDEWAEGAAGLTFEDTKVHVLVMDEQGKLNLNLLETKNTKQISRVHSELKRLAKVVGLDESEADNMADSIRDRVDKDGQGRFEENSPNRGFMNLSQLMDLEPVAEPLYYGTIPEDDIEESTPGICRFVTIWGPGRVNINTAPAEVLAALSGKIDIETAVEIVEYRDEGEIFMEVKDLLDVPSVTPDMFSDISGKVCVSSSYFSVLCFAETEGVRSVGVSIIYRDTGGCKVMQSFAGDSKLWRTYLEEVGEMEEREEEEGNEL